LLQHAVELVDGKLIAMGRTAFSKILSVVMRALKSKLVGRTLLALAIVSGGLAFALSAAVQFGLFTSMPDADAINTAIAPNPPSIPPTASPAPTPKKTARKVEKGPKADPSLVAWLEAGVGFESAPAKLIPANGIPNFDRLLILADYDHRISPQFSVQPEMRDRVGFWFDVYTRYNSNQKLIHHSVYPWLVFKVMDVTDIVNASEPRVKWLRVEKAEKLVKAEAHRIREAVKSLAKRKNLDDLDEYEKLVAETLKPLGGSIQKQARLAIGEVRVQTGQRDFFMEGLRVGPLYLATMEKIFKAQRLPVELTRMPFVESSFNRNATSKVGAAGIWQLMDNTGRKFLVVNSAIDERRSPYKSTYAAARLLKENHQILYRSWPLAITAWNHGPGGVKKAARAVGSRELSQIVARYRTRSFDFASANFYSEFLAALHAERYQDEIFGKIERLAPLELHAVVLPRAIRPSALMKASGLSRQDFLAMNPDIDALLKSDAFVPAGFTLHVPHQARLGLERGQLVASRISESND
jgi:membrane-bound lytic murein transglycosylase D